MEVNVRSNVGQKLKFWSQIEILVKQLVTF